MNTDLTGRQVRAFRMDRQALSHLAGAAALPDVVAAVCGIQAQVMAAARLAIWARNRDATIPEIEGALWQTRTLVKTWSMRGTVHLLPSSALPVYVAALGESGTREVQRWIAKHGVDPRSADELTVAIVEALSPGPLTRRELAEQLVETLGEQARPWIDHSWGGIVKQACVQGLVCFGPDKGREVTFVRRDQWLPGQREVPADSARTSLMRTYLQCYGPATVQDFAGWAGMAVRDAERTWQELEEETVQVMVDGRARGRMLQDDLGRARERSPAEAVVRLLPSFDPYLLGHRDKQGILDLTHYKKVYRKAGWLAPVVLIDGLVAATWSHKRSDRRMLVVVEPFMAMSDQIRDLIHEQIQGLSTFLGVESNLVIVNPSEG